MLEGEPETELSCFWKVRIISPCTFETSDDAPRRWHRVHATRHTHPFYLYESDED